MCQELLQPSLTWQVPQPIPARHVPLAAFAYASRQQEAILLSPVQVSHTGGCLGLTPTCPPVAPTEPSSLSSLAYLRMQLPVLWEIQETTPPLSTMLAGMLTPKHLQDPFPGQCAACLAWVRVATLGSGLSAFPTHP